MNAGGESVFEPGLESASQTGSMAKTLPVNPLARIVMINAHNLAPVNLLAAITHEIGHRMVKGYEIVPTAYVGIALIRR